MNAGIDEVLDLVYVGLGRWVKGYGIAVRHFHTQDSHPTKINNNTRTNITALFLFFPSSFIFLLHINYYYYHHISYFSSSFSTNVILHLMRIYIYSFFVCQTTDLIIVLFFKSGNNKVLDIFFKEKYKIIF